MSKVKVGVIAGTPVDTQMGVDFLKYKGIYALGYAVSSCPEEQSKFQILSPLKLTLKIREIINKAKDDDVNVIMIYCNSLSAAVDMDRLAIEENIRIITPLSVYKNIALNYKIVGVITANNQSSAGIEKVIQSVNPNCNVIGLGILPLVIDIEEGIPAKKIIEKFSLKDIMRFYKTIKADVVILGCTHFSYLYEELKEQAFGEILDPSELMYEMICEN